MKLISHRGNDNHKYKENTKEAILSSINQNYIDGVEFDIRLTKDNYFVLSHNMITYNSGSIKNQTVKELKKEGLSELNEVLNSLKSNKYIVIDIKENSNNYKKTAKKLNKILKKYNLNYYICSFNYELVKYIKEKYKYKTGLLISNILNKNKNYEIFDFISIKYNLYNNQKITTMIWTVNNIEIAKKYINKDIFIITDKPYLIRQL